MSRMCTLHEIAMQFANKQPGMVDALTEAAPVLDMMKWIPSTHGLWNVAEKLTEIEGPGWVMPDSPMPPMHVGSDLVHTDLHVMAGKMEVPTQRAIKFGGAAKYFADRQDAILKRAGMDVEKRIVKDNWFKAAKDSNNLRDAGGNGGWYLLAVRFDDLSNVGLYDPDQFDTGRLLKISMPYGGEEHYLIGKKYEGVLGFTITYTGNFGWQILDAPRTCAAIVNIDNDNIPTAMMIDDMLADIRADTGSTYLICHPKCKNHAINSYKKDYVQLTNSDTDAKTRIETWNGISILQTYNVEKTQRITTGMVKE